jgi:D-alanyl-lipoteichoic acid acyltransferase DltB (MBOAT superfamily)
MVPLLRLLVPFVLFPAASAGAFRLVPARSKAKMLAFINILGILGLCLVNGLGGLYFWQLETYLQVAIPVFALYLLAVLLHYDLMRRYALKEGWVVWVSFLFPLALMATVKYVPAVSDVFGDKLKFIGRKTIAEFFIGISYMAFRLSRLVLEVRNGVVPLPSIWEYLSFAFFVPTFVIGPISRYSIFRESLEHPDRRETPLGTSALRILVGLTKYLFLASLIEQLSYTGLLLDGHPHKWIDVPIAAFSFYIYLYLNFSGYCDMAIGTAGLIGIRVDENFRSPFQSRNIQEFWTRWHITLSSYMRDTVFSPLSRILTRKFGAQAAPHAIAISMFIVFLAIGMWHGLSANFLIFGSLQGIGMVSCHYYTIWLKKSLGRVGYAAYQDNGVIRAAAVILTFSFVTATQFFFANSLENTRTIMSLLR